jgi:hypothetical protein
MRMTNAHALPLSSRVSMELGRPTLFINEQAVNPIMYSLTDVPGGRWSWEEIPQRNIQLFSEAGVRLFQVDLFLEHLWLEEGCFDLSRARKQIRGVIDVCPQAAVFIRFHVNAPKWWIARHPEENTLYADAEAKPDNPWGLQRILLEDAATPVRTSLASKKWLQEAGDKLQQFCRELAACDEGAYLAGLQLAGGIYGEWHYWGLLHNEPDVSQPMQDHFRDWLADKYPTDHALQQAWHDRHVTLATAQVPRIDKRLHTQDGLFRDPRAERCVIDYYQCQHELVADDILFFCRIARQTWPRPLAVGAFYGYYFSVFGREATGGHLALQRVLRSPEIDFLCGPNVYYPENSEVGDPYRSRGLLESIRLHGKLWLDEMDQQPYLKSAGAPDFDLSLANSIALLRRNTLFTFTKGMGLWFYDFGAAGLRQNSTAAEFVTGWWDHPALMQDIASLKQFLDRARSKPYHPEAELLMVFDTACFYHTAIRPDLNAIGDQAVNWTTLAAYRAGAVFDAIHLDDLTRVDLSAYKAVLFVNTFVISPEQRDWIRQQLFRQGRHVLFVYAPGYCDGEQNRAEFIGQVTGIRVKRLDLTAAAEIRLSDPEQVWKVSDQPVSPLFAVVDEQAISLAKYGQTSETAVAKKPLADATSWFLGLPPVDGGILRRYLEQTGVHFYATMGDIYYSGSGTVVLHSKTGGLKQITLKNGKRIELELPAGGQTVVLDSESGELIHR